MPTINTGERRIKNVVMVMDVIPNARLHHMCNHPAFANIFLEAHHPQESDQGALLSSKLPVNIGQQTSDLVKQLWDVIECCNAEATIDVSTLLAELIRAVCAVDEDGVSDPHDSEFFSISNSHEFCSYILDF